MTVSEMHPMGVGEILDRSFQTLRRNFGVLFATAAIGLSPLLVLYLVIGTTYADFEAVETPTAAVMTAMGILGLVMVPTMIVMWGALTSQVDADATGGVVAVGAGLRTGFRALLRMIGAGIVAVVVLIGLAVGLGIPAGIIMVAAEGLGAALASPVLSGIVVTVTFLAWGFVTMAVWGSMAFLTVPVLVIESLGPVMALGRANALAKGGRIRVLMTAFMANLVVALPALGLQFLLIASSGMWSASVAGQVSTTQLYLYQAVIIGVNAATTPFLLATAVYTYYDRRVRREGLDVELASATAAASV